MTLVDEPVCDAIYMSKYLQECEMDIHKIFASVKKQDDLIYHILDNIPIYVLLKYVSRCHKGDLEIYMNHLNRKEYELIRRSDNIFIYIMNFKLLAVGCAQFRSIVYIALYMTDYTYENFINAIIQCGSNISHYDIVSVHKLILPYKHVPIDNVLKQLYKPLEQLYDDPYIINYMHRLYFTKCNYSSVKVSDVDKLDEIHNIYYSRNYYLDNILFKKVYITYCAIKHIEMEYNKW